MKKSRFSEEQFIAILREHEQGGDSGGLSPAWRQQRHVLQVEG